MRHSDREETSILEAIVTTLNADGSVHVSPMGPRVDARMDHFLLRPYETSTTLANLERERQGVLHVTDDVELLARAAVGALEHLPAMQPARAVRGMILAGACRWYAFRVSDCRRTGARAELDCDVVDRGRLRDFFGFNRAKHAVVEGAILATRLAFLPHDHVLREFEHLEVIIDKTAGPQERRAFAFLQEYVRNEVTAEGVE